MRKIEEKTPPHPLVLEFEEADIFKYGALEYLERTLKECTLKFSRLKDYNDPFETKFQYRHRFENDTERLEYYNNNT